MANQEHLDILKQGVETWNQWRQEHADIRPDLSEAHLSRVELPSANLSRADLRKATLSRANLIEADLDSANLQNADLRSADLRYASLSLADLSGANLMSSHLVYTNLVAANLSGANLSRSQMKHPNLSGIELSGADLSGIELEIAYMNDADLSGANLSGARVRWSNLSGSNLSGANLSGADMYWSNLSGTNLSGANLSEANLLRSDLSGSNLSDADLSLTKLGGTVIAHLDFRTTKGLTKIQHQGPSHIDLYSVQFSQDGGALHFLRGAGVPEEWIDSWRTTMMHPIQYHSVFISYSSKDDMLARRLHADLQDYGVRCWFAPEDMKIGDEIRSRVDEAIHLQEKLLLLLSKHSLSSTWVKNEVEAAFEKEEKQRRLMLFPIRLDESVEQTTTSWAATLRRTRHIGDFTNWKEPEAYQRAFERLLRDLQAEQGWR